MPGVWDGLLVLVLLGMPCGCELLMALHHLRDVSRLARVALSAMQQVHVRGDDALRALRQQGRHAYVALAVYHLARGEAVRAAREAADLAAHAAPHLRHEAGAHMED